MVENGPGEAPPVGAEAPDGEAPGSFFADRLAEVHRPWRCGKVEVPPPDDVAVADLDDSDGPVDDLEILCPGPLFDQVCDVLDADRTPPGDAAADALAHFHLDRAPGVGWHELVERINLYGPGIEYDLWEHGRDLADYFTGRVPGGWDHLLRVLGRLPMGSHYRSAVADDDALADEVLRRHGPEHTRPKRAGRPPLTEFSREIAYLHLIANRLGYLQWAVFAAQAGKKRGNPPRPDRGPETAAERAELRDHMREHDEVVAQVLTHQGRSRPTPDDGRSDGRGDARGPAPEAVRGAVLLDPPAIGGGDDDSD